MAIKQSYGYLKEPIKLSNRKLDNSNASKSKQNRDHGTFLSLETNFTGSEYYHGNMFDVQAFANISVHYLDVHGSLSTNITYFVFTKMGGYNGYEQSPDDWISVANGTLQSESGSGKTFSTDLFSPPIIISAFETQAFYITLSNPDIITSVGSVEGQSFASNSHIEIQEGVGVMGNQFSRVVFRPRVFNGAIHYSVNDRNFTEDANSKTPSLNDTSISPTITENRLRPPTSGSTEHESSMINSNNINGNETSSNTESSNQTSNESIVNDSIHTEMTRNRLHYTPQNQTSPKSSIDLSNSINNELYSPSLSPSSTSFSHPSSSKPLHIHASNFPTQNQRVFIGRERKHGNLTRDPTQNHAHKSDTSNELSKYSNSTNPSVNPIEYIITPTTTNYTYEFEIQYPENIEVEQIFSEVDVSVTSILLSLFEDTKLYDLILLSVESSSMKFQIDADSFCKSVATGNKCITVNCVVAINHSNNLSSNEVQNLLRAYSFDISEKLDFPSVQYIGIRPISTYIAIGIDGNHLNMMRENEVVIFEHEVSKFLDVYFDKNYPRVYMLNTKVSSQKYEDLNEISSFNKDPKKLRNLTSGRTRIHDSERSSLSSASITNSTSDFFNSRIILNIILHAEYQRPPIIDFYSISREAFSEGNGAFIKTISPICFSNRAISLELYQGGAEGAQNAESPTKSDFKIQYLYPLYVVLFIVCCYVCFRFRKQRRKTRKRKVLAAVKTMKFDLITGRHFDPPNTIFHSP